MKQSLSLRLTKENENYHSLPWGRGLGWGGDFQVKKFLSLVLLIMMVTSCGGGGGGGEGEGEGSHNGEVEGCVDVAPDSDAFNIESGEIWINSGNGSLLYLRILQPDSNENREKCFPALIPIPGGFGNGAPLADSPIYRDLASKGFVVVTFNLPGRGNNLPGNLQSDGLQNYNGFIDQDALKAVIEYVSGLQNVTMNNIGVQTSSFGITAGAGVLGRYPELPVKYLIDFEGPSECFNTAFETWALDSDPSNDRHEQFHRMTGHYCTTRDPSSENESWWAEREALRYVGSIRARYMRVQNQWDHAQPPNMQYPSWDYPPLWYQNKHAIDMVNAATNGSSPWTRINGDKINNPTNTIYSRESPPEYYTYPKNGVPSQEIVPLIVEMAKMPPL
ncbi:MAG TPA: hypothetical protein ENH07_02900 [Nitrospirae bacterium]|nr:hypothetical protein BMS3Abin08_00379 [bacterium BMS3Abin08]HDO35231.1 hypothetical protein [Nitrospirota bacterium]